MSDNPKDEVGAFDRGIDLAHPVTHKQRHHGDPAALFGELGPDGARVGNPQPAQLPRSKPTSADKPYDLWKRSQETGESYLDLMEQAGHLVRRSIEKCRSCQAEIYWTRTAATGKRMPVDATPVADGNLVLSQFAGDLVAQKYDASERGHANRRRFVSHFATCPEGRQWRRRDADQRDVEQLQQHDTQAEARRNRR